MVYFSEASVLLQWPFSKQSGLEILTILSLLDFERLVSQIFMWVVLRDIKQVICSQISI